MPKLTGWEQERDREQAAADALARAEATRARQAARAEAAAEPAPVEPDPEPNADPEPEPDVEPELVRPHGNASRDKWVDYATALGLTVDEDDTRRDIIAAVTAQVAEKWDAPPDDVTSSG